MRTSLTVFFAFIVALVARCEPPLPEPIETAFARFQETYPARCQDLIQKLTSHVSPSFAKAQKVKFEVLGVYAGNLHGAVLDTARARKNPNQGSPVFWQYNRLRVDITGFRRTFDSLLVEAAVAKAFHPDDAFMKSVREFWDDEYFYSWRFSYELEIATMKTEPNQTLQRTPDTAPVSSAESDSRRR